MTGALVRLTPAQMEQLREDIANHRRVLDAVIDAEWRTGRTLGTTLYAVGSQDNRKEDTYIGRMETPAMAAHVVTVHNGCAPTQTGQGAAQRELTQLREAAALVRRALDDFATIAGKSAELSQAWREREIWSAVACQVREMAEDLPEAKT